MGWGPGPVRILGTLGMRNDYDAHLETTVSLYSEARNSQSRDGPDKQFSPLVQILIMGRDDVWKPKSINTERFADSPQAQARIPISIYFGRQERVSDGPRSWLGCFASVHSI
jgi:hypothetical protein